MTDDARAFDLHAQQQSVAIAICVGRDYFQPVTGTLAFGPELISRAAEEGDVAFREGELSGLAVHEADHQDFAVGGVLHNCREKAVELIEIEFVASYKSSQRNKKPAERGTRQRAEILRVLGYVRCAPPPPRATRGDDGGDGRETSC